MSDYIFPVPGGTLTSGFGLRERPTSGASRNHMGIDLAAPSGSPVVAPISGQVISAGMRGGYGNQVQIMGSDGITHSFSHLQGFSVRPGMNVTAGQQVGLVGSTGTATGPHLHYETIRDGLKINPSGVLKNATSYGVGVAKRTAEKLLSGIVSNPASILTPGGPALGSLIGGLGFGGTDCGVICQLQNWVKESQFFQRLALAILAFIILFAAFYLMKSNVVSSVVNRVKG